MQNGCVEIMLRGMLRLVYICCASIGLYAGVVLSAKSVL